jgi:transcriptional regulator with PAS, ATPase and Fis domain
MTEERKSANLPLADPSLDLLTQAALSGVTRALASVGRAFICLDPRLHVVHASHLIDRFLGEGTAVKLRGRPIEELLGEDLFGPTGLLRQALLAGEKREGWRGTLQFGESGPRLVSLTAAPLLPEPANICDPRIAHLIILRPAEEDGAYSCAPTFFSGVVACSGAMQRVVRLVETLQQSEATVLISGESGTGKEVVATAIHQHSPREKGRFVAINCGALPSELLESELFGHVRGAFTGAVRDRVGRFEMASQGTLFLDEIGDVPMPLQVKLLRVLQERTYERVGESTTRTTNARIIAATNIDLRHALAQGRFREDLFYRLCVVPIEIPPLRERREDIAPLTNHLLASVTSQHNLVKRLSPQAMKVLLDYRWPGNVRELANAIEYAVAVSKSETILPEDLPEEVQRPRAEMKPDAKPAGEAARARNLTPGDLESRRILAALEASHWSRDAAARALGMSRTTLWRKMREFRLG